MKMRPGPIRIVCRGCLMVGLALLLIFGFAHVHRFLSVRAETNRFQSLQRVSDGVQQAAGMNEENQTTVPPAPLIYAKDKLSGKESAPGPLAMLRIPALHLEVPVLEGTDEITLNRGVGRIAGTALPGQGGNIGIAGHRDSFFRHLEHIGPGDCIELVTLGGTDIYEVDQVRVTTPSDVDVLRPRAKNSLTLVTCYPFRFIGPAPSRYIVEASLKQ